MSNLIIPIGFFVISSIYLVMQLFLAFKTAWKIAKAYKTENWYIYNTTANFKTNHIAFWFVFTLWIYSLNVIITGGYSL